VIILCIFPAKNDRAEKSSHVARCEDRVDPNDKSDMRARIAIRAKFCFFLVSINVV